MTGDATIQGSSEPAGVIGRWSRTVARAISQGVTLLKPAGKASYDAWVARYDTLTEKDIAAIRRHIAALHDTPVISLAMFIGDPPSRCLLRSLAAVIAQLYPHWELCIAHDGSVAAEVGAAIAASARDDDRIKVNSRPWNGDIVAARNAALALVTGDFVAFIGEGDELSAAALYLAAVELNAHPTADILYSDEDELDADGRRHAAYFKPDWNPELFLAQNLVNHLGVYRSTLVRAVDGLRGGVDGHEDHDLALRLVARTEPHRIRHIPHILYHRRTLGVPAGQSSHRALADYFAERGEAVEILAGRLPGHVRVKRLLPDPPPRVSLIVPTRDRLELLRPCVEGLLGKTRYPNLDIIIVDNESVEPATIAYLQGLARAPGVRILRIEGPFNFSALNNRAVEMADGEIIGFINNDIEVIEPGWLEELVSQAVRPGVGAVGAKLYYRNDTIQHAGVILGMRGTAGHGHRHVARSAPGYGGQLQLVRNVSCVTGACLVLPKRIFLEVGGFNEIDLTVAFNDVDLCLKIRAAGYSIVWTPYAELYHIEGASRGSDAAPENQERSDREVAHMKGRWTAALQEDPFYNPNLSLADEGFGLAFPPRAAKPWRLQPIPAAMSGNRHDARLFRERKASKNA